MENSQLNSSEIIHELKLSFSLILKLDSCILRTQCDLDTNIIAGTSFGRRTTTAHTYAFILILIRTIANARISTECSTPNHHLIENTQQRVHIAKETTHMRMIPLHYTQERVVVYSCKSSHQYVRSLFIFLRPPTPPHAIHTLILMGYIVHSALSMYIVQTYNKQM